MTCITAAMLSSHWIDLGRWLQISSDHCIPNHCIEFDFCLFVVFTERTSSLSDRHDKVGKRIGVEH